MRSDTRAKAHRQAKAAGTTVSFCRSKAFTPAKQEPLLLKQRHE
jgi:hypothetical protein